MKVQLLLFKLSPYRTVHLLTFDYWIEKTSPPY